MPSLNKLVILDTRQLKIAHYVTAPDDALFAASRSKLVVLQPQAKILQRFALATGEKESTVVCRVDAATQIAMGDNSDGPIIVLAGGDDLGRGDNLTMFDLQTLKPVEFNIDGNAFGFEGARAWASQDGKTFGFERMGYSPSGLTVLTLSGTKGRLRYAHDSVGRVVPSSDGSLIFTDRGLYNADLKRLDDERRRPDGLSCWPCGHPAYFVGARVAQYERQTPRLSLYSAADRRELVALPPLPELLAAQDVIRERTELDYPERFFVLFRQQRILSLPWSNERVIGRKFDPIETLRTADIDYLFVASTPPSTAEPGKRYVYPIAVESRRGHVKLTLESGPEGMTLDKKGQLTWMPPTEARGSDISVIVLVTDASGQEVFHSFSIQVPSAAR